MAMRTSGLSRGQIKITLEQARNGDDEALCALCTSFDEGREYFMKDKSDRCSGCGTEFTPDNEPAIIIVVHFLDALDANGGDPSSSMPFVTSAQMEMVRTSSVANW